MPFLRLAQVAILLICLTLFAQAGFADVTGLTNQVEQQTERISEQAGNLTEEEADLTAISNRLVKERSTAQSSKKSFVSDIWSYGKISVGWAMKAKARRTGSPPASVDCRHRCPENRD